MCGRRLLIGERSNAFIAREGAEVVVCELCKPRAEAAGWLRPDEFAAARSTGGGRRRRRRGSGELLSGLRARVERVQGSVADAEADALDEEEDFEPLEGEEGSEPDARPARPARRSRTRERDRSRSRDRERGTPAASEPQNAPTMRSSAGPDVLEAINAFNVSDARRTVSGLSKALGEPMATALAVRTASGDTGARITVAWELAWYQWEVGPGRRAPEIREIAKGETIDQLRAADRNWNLDVSRDGTLARRPVGGPPE